MPQRSLGQGEGQRAVGQGALRLADHGAEQAAAVGEQRHLARLGREAGGDGQRRAGQVRPALGPHDVQRQRRRAVFDEAGERHGGDSNSTPNKPSPRASVASPMRGLPKPRGGSIC